MASLADGQSARACLSLGSELCCVVELRIGVCCRFSHRAEPCCSTDVGVATPTVQRDVNPCWNSSLVITDVAESDMLKFVVIDMGRSNVDVCGDPRNVCVCRV